MSTESTELGSRGHPDGSDLVEVALFEGKNRIPITGVIAVLFALFGAMYVWVGPELVAGEAVSDLLDALPPVMTELFGFESLESLEGLLASEFYTLGWIVGLGGYMAYTAAGTVAGDLRDHRLDTLLAGPVTRRSILFGKYLALLVPIIALNVVIPTMLYVASVAVGEPLAIVNLAALHVLSIPYLLCWSAIGLFLGVVVRRGRTAGRVALGLVFIGWIFESVISATDYGWVGGVSPVRYFDPPQVLIHGTYDVVGAGVLLGTSIVFLGLSQIWFQRQDL